MSRHYEHDCKPGGGHPGAGTLRCDGFGRCGECWDVWPCEDSKIEQQRDAMLRHMYEAHVDTFDACYVCAGFTGEYEEELAAKTGE